MGKLALLTGIMKNSRSLKSKFGFQNGYFGKRGKGRKSNTRNIPSKNPLQTAKDFFDTLVQDAAREILKNDTASRMVSESISQTEALSYFAQFLILPTRALPSALTPKAVALK